MAGITVACFALQPVEHAVEHAVAHAVANGATINSAYDMGYSRACLQAGWHY